MKTLIIALMLAGLFPASIELSIIDFNFWNTGVDPHNGTGTSVPQNWITSSSVVNAENITYTLASTSHTLSSPISNFGATCFSDEAYTKKDKSPRPQSIPLDSSNTPCAMTYNDIALAQQKQGWAAAYDTNKYFVEHCYTNQFATAGITGSDNIVQNGGLGSPPGCWEQNLQWLLTLFPLRQDANWFCSIVQAIAGSGMNSVDTSYQQINTETNRGMSVIYWINHNPLCANSPDSELYINGRGSQISTWLDTQDTSKVPLDTTIYSMHDLGLDSVLKYAALLGVNEGNAPSIITNATAYPNPTGEGTVVSFGVSREAYVTIGLFDILGHEVTSPSFGGVVETGNLSVPLTLQGLPSGTYFARIMTTFGEVQTVKIVKE